MHLIAGIFAPSIGAQSIFAQSIRAQSIVAQLQQFVLPDFSPAYLQAELKPLWQTIEIAAGGMLFALSIGLLLGVVIGARLPGWRLPYALLTALRSIPDLTLAIVCVVLVGIGPGAGMLAIALYYCAVTGKTSGDLLASADAAPVEALAGTGAGRIAVALYGLLPLRLSDVMSYGAYDFECAVRAAVIVGAVGAGGIGAELAGTINTLDYHRTATLVLLLVLFIAVLDKMAWLVRKHPRLLLGLVALGLYSAWDLWPGMFAASHTAEVLRRMWPPRLLPEQLHAVPGLIGETLLIAIAGTAVAIVLAVPLGALAARNIAPVYITFPVRRLLELMRAIPEVIWGLLLVCAAIIGPRAGILALGLHGMGVFGRLFSESMENVRPEPVWALAATGAGQVAVTIYSIMPLAFPPMLIQMLFRLEWNIRAAAVVGMIGAGGLGQALYNAQQLFFYDQMLAYVLITLGLVILTDLVAASLRRHWHVAEAQT
jgi:phosphonate transport system permease protein